MQEMKRILILFNILLVTISVQSQSIKEDTTRILELIKTSRLSPYDKPDSTLVFADSIISMSTKVNYLFGLARGHSIKGECYWVKGDYARSMYHVLQEEELYRQLNYETFLALNKGNLAQIYYELGDYSLTLQYNFETRRFLLAAPDTLHMTQLPKERALMMNNLDLAKSYLLGNKLDSALFYGEKALTFYRNEKQMWSYCSMVVGNILEKMNQDSAALAIYNLETTLSSQNDLVEIDIGKATIFKKMHLIDSSRYYAQKALESAQSNHYLKSIMRASNLLSSTYEQNNTSEFIKYLKIADAARDSLFSKEKINQLNGFLLNNELRQRDREAVEIKYKNQKRTFLLLMISVIFLVAGILLWRNNQLRKKSNILLKNEKEKVEATLRELKSTQSQLIQSEKMASLGELTAGIAHEIQNPLNFVNNFSEINAELILELKGQRLKVKGERDEYIETELLKNIEENEIKIHQHGKRADAIVKGMLQHSQKGSGTKTTTNINVLAEEYLKLSYHAFQAGYRSKDQNFFAELKLDLDPSLPLVKVIPQDMGRVFLNLFNNAFWFSSEALANRGISSEVLAKEGRTNLAGLQTEISGINLPGFTYSPIITLTTKNLGNSIEIRVRDNGPGIPANHIDKIFQPFFTTKPTGQGTGLGLSLSYDIIKAHGGTITVNSVNHPSEGTEFVVVLPM